MKFLTRLSIFLVLTVVFSCEKEREPIRLQGFVFGTTYSIIYYDNTENYEKEIKQLFDKVNQSLSTYVENSDISKINRGESELAVDEYFQEVFTKSARIYKETEGYFDPTVGNLVNAWGFGPEKPLKQLSDQQVDSLMEFVGFDKVQLIENKIEKEIPEVYFDFNAIAKGYGIDVIGRFLESQGVSTYLVEIGGEIRVRGLKPEGLKWSIQIDAPNMDGTRSAYDLISLTDVSMASSGNYRKYRISESGQKYVHTINPKTGYAIESNLLAANVIAPLDCADVDAYATAFMAMGFEKTKAFLNQIPELKVILIYVDAQGEIQEYRN